MAGKAAVMRLLLRDGAVTLRPFAPADFDQLWAEETRDRGSFEAPWGADDEQARARVRARVDHSGTWRDQRVLDLAVELEGRVVGDVQARRDPSYEPPGLFDLGIGLFRDHRGVGVGTTAIALIAAFLFDEEQAVRVSLSTDVDNVAMRRVAEKTGFIFEGIMRGFWRVPDGPARDYALYGRTRADYGA
ncbi:MAG: GNAT family N-acetyltransferase [Actinomycetota bacterium]|nr:GNAT family N-acetyltransferase [Actinomycetota bacterium]